MMTPDLPESLLLLAGLIPLMASSCTPPKGSPASAPTPAPASRPVSSDLSHLGWLVGSWTGQQGDRRTEERWVQPHPALLLGSNVTALGGEVVQWEHLQIEALDGRVVYRAWPKGQGHAAFVQSAAGAQQVQFSAPERDFPQQIRYRRAGDTLHAEVEGVEGGEPRRQQWTWSLDSEAAPAPGDLRLEQVVLASVDAVWRAWTTVEGAQSFFAPQARIELRPGGAYEMYFMLEAPEGSRGGEGCTVVEITPPRRLVITWNFPPTLPTLRAAHTLVIVELTPAGGGATRVAATQRGWRAGQDWEQGRQYFQRAWGLVLSRLAQRFEQGPLDWSKI